jgi:hypothetical protein
MAWHAELHCCIECGQSHLAADWYGKHLTNGIIIYVCAKKYILVENPSSWQPLHKAANLQLSR